MSESTEPDTVLIFVPERRYLQAKAEISRVAWIFEVEQKYRVITVDEFIRQWGSDGWDTPEFLDRLLAAGIEAVTHYRGLNRQEFKTVMRLIESTSTVAKGRAEQAQVST